MMRKSDPHVQADPMLVLRDIVTMDPALPRAEAMATSGGTIVAIGTHAETAAALPSGAEVHRAPGTLAPGLIDSHLHLQWGAEAAGCSAPSC